MKHSKENQPYEYVLAFIGVLFALAMVFHRQLPFYKYEIVDAGIAIIVTSFAAFFGAYFAFHLNYKKSQDEKDDRNIAGVNRAIFALAVMRNSLLNYKIQFLDENRGDEFAFINVRPMGSKWEVGQQIDYYSISFILETEYKNVLGELTVTEGMYKAIVNGVNTRSHDHINYVQTEMEKAGIKPGSEYSLARIQTILGPRMYETMVQTTADIFKTVDETLIKIKETSDQLSETLQALYPVHAVRSPALTSPDSDKPS